MENILENKFLNIKRWKLGSQTAVHKPLLILYVLSQYKNGHKRLFNFEYEIYDQLRELLGLYGQQVRSQHPEYPFWRLQNDGFWEVKTQERILLTSSGDAPKRQLFESEAVGGFKPQFYDKLSRDRHVIDVLSVSLIKSNFRVSLHKPLIQYFEINLALISPNKLSESELNPYSCGPLLEELISEMQI